MSKSDFQTQNWKLNMTYISEIEINFELVRFVVEEGNYMCYASMVRPSKIMETSGNGIIVCFCTHL